MEILIAGKGFIGQTLGERLKDNHEVSYLDLEGADYSFDITRDFSIEESFDVLVHAIGLPPGFASQEQYQQVHVEGTRNLADAVEAEVGVFFSALGAGEVDHSFFRTKREAERIFDEKFDETVILRPSTVYGKGNKLLDSIRKLSITRLFPDIRTFTQPIRIEDLSAMAEVLIEQRETGTFTAAGPEKFTLGELACRIYSEEGRRCFLVPYPRSLLELELRLLSFLQPPFQEENIELLRHENVADENDAEMFVDLSGI